MSNLTDGSGGRAPGATLRGLRCVRGLHCGGLRCVWGLRWVLSLALAFTMVSTLASAWVAQELSPVRSGEGSSDREHVVRKGDTLWDLAEFYLSDPFDWGRIWDANRGTVRNPHLIYPNDRILIPIAEIRERLTEGLPLVASGPDRTIFYRGIAGAGGGASGSDLAVLEGGQDEEVAAVQSGEYLSAPWISDRSRLPLIGSLVRIRGQGSDRDRISQSVHPQDRVYIEYHGRERPEVGDTLVLVREGRRVGGWGRIFEPGGLGVVEEVTADVALVAVVNQFGRLGPRDLALPLGSVPAVRGHAEPVDDGLRATLVGFVEEQPVYDTSDLAFVDRGSRDGVAIGDEFEVVRPQRTARGWFGPTLPEESVARVRVVRVEDRTSTVRLIGLNEGGLESGMPVRLVGKMP